MLCHTCWIPPGWGVQILMTSTIDCVSVCAFDNTRLADVSSILTCPFPPSPSPYCHLSTHSLIKLSPGTLLPPHHVRRVGSISAGVTGM